MTAPVETALCALDTGIPSVREANADLNRHSRRWAFKLLAVAGLSAVAACNGVTVQTITADALQVFQTSVTAITAFLAQMGVAVPASITALLAKIQAIGQQVVAGISAVVAGGYVQQAFAAFTEIVQLAASLFGGALPSSLGGAVGTITTAFNWLEQALGIAPAVTTSAVYGAAPATDPATILAGLNRVIAATP